MPRDQSIKVRFTAEEMDRIDEETAAMRKSLVSAGIAFSRSDAVRYMMFSSDRHLARLHDVPVHVLQHDVAKALHALEWDSDKIVATMETLQAAHDQARKERREQLGPMDVKDIVPGQS